MDILQRYWTLRNANNDLQQQQNERTAELDAARKHNAETLQRLQQELLVRNSNIHGMQRKIESLPREPKAGVRLSSRSKTVRASRKTVGRLSCPSRICTIDAEVGKTSKPPKIAFSEKTQQLAYMEACLYTSRIALDLSGVAAGYESGPRLRPPRPYSSSREQ